MISIDEIDKVLLGNITGDWRKLSFVVGLTMLQIDKEMRVGLDDTFFAQRVASLIEDGRVEVFGEVSALRECEVRQSRT